VTPQRETREAATRFIENPRRCLLPLLVRPCCETDGEYEKGMLTFPRVSLVSARGGIRRLAMENQAQNKVYLHYNHTDPCRYARWNARYFI
jgi:hypothetical protein